MTYQQIECKAKDAHMVVVVEANRVKEGDCVSFKQTGAVRWSVLTVFPQIIEDVNRGWGLDLPKSQRLER